MTTRISSRAFNQDTASAKRAAMHGPVIITDRGEAAHVLLTWDAYERLVLGPGRLVDRLGEPPGIEDVDLPLPIRDDRPRPATFE
ncbi:MAG: type II toxin-antitoxin system Phd/YefM family antitoxin [Chloroflexi bacterium]|nr:type II toxin-antitoxin system Phd/YefM family antitoxin [Chloroflexota bacterium]